jgi:Uma2 family endonuclease
MNQIVCPAKGRVVRCCAMTALPSRPAFVLAGEYLRLEAQASEKHEFHDGRIYAMACGTYRHSQVVTRVLVGLFNRLQGKQCQPTDSSTRVATRPGRNYMYPDVTVICGPAQFDPNDRNQTTITNPTLVVEVLSEGTEAYDRGKKFERYREAETLKEYVLVLTTEPRVETFLRQGDGTWLFTSYSGLDAVTRLRSLEMDLPLAEVFGGIEFSGSDDEGGGTGSAVT